MMASVAGSIIGAPMPSISDSPTSRLGTFHDNAASSEPPPNRAAPTMNMRRWPNTSPRRPPMMSSVAKTSE